MSHDSTDRSECGKKCNHPLVALSDFERWMQVSLPPSELTTSELSECQIVECLLHQIEAHFIAHVIHER